MAGRRRYDQMFKFNGLLFTIQMLYGIFLVMGFGLNEHIPSVHLLDNLNHPIGGYRMVCCFSGRSISDWSLLMKKEAKWTLP